MGREPEYNATIVQRNDLHDGLFFIWLQPDGGDYPEFEPGQFVSIGRIDDESSALIKRTYSLGSSARRRETLELFIVHVDDGEFTSWLRDQPVGARLWLSPKAGGTFTLDGVRPGTDLVLVSTGTGIAPYLSMYRTLRDNPPWRRFVLINGVRYAQDLGYRSELEAVGADDAAFRYIPLVTREAEGSSWRGTRGRVNSILEPGVYESLVGASLSPDHCHVFLCGNPAMVDSLETELKSRGFVRHRHGHPGTLHLEKYWQETS